MYLRVNNYCHLKNDLCILSTSSCDKDNKYSLLYDGFHRKIELIFSKFIILYSF